MKRFKTIYNLATICMHWLNLQFLNYLDTVVHASSLSDLFYVRRGDIKPPHSKIKSGNMFASTGYVCN